jgi:hypothetical protein
MKRAALVLATLLASQAHATQPTHIGLHIGSHHLTRAPAYVGEWNDANPGVYARWASGFTLGTLLNSERRQSTYAGFTLEGNTLAGYTPAVTVGLITGYTKPVGPLLALSVSRPITDSFSARLSWLPKARVDGSHALHLSIEWRL